MTIEWTYDNPSGDEFEVNPERFIGKSKDWIGELLLMQARDNCRQQATCYVPNLDSYVAQIMADNAASEANNE